MNLVLLWGSFGLWQGIFLAASFFVAASPDPTMSWAPPLCGLFGLALAGASVGLGLWRGIGLQPLVILRGVMSEAAALFGVVSWYLSGEHLVQLGVAAAALCAWGLAFPRAPEP